MLTVSDASPSLAAGGETENPVASLTEPTPAYLLAAEADAVPSNLDRLPPNSRRVMKRKSEPAVQEGERKRGKYGGIVGRPRKPERESHNPAQNETPLPGNTETALDLSPQMITRRSARRSAAASWENAKSAEPTEDLPRKGSKSPKKQAVSSIVTEEHDKPPTNDIPMKDLEEDANDNHEDTSTPARRTKKPTGRLSAVSTNNLPLKRASAQDVPEEVQAKTKPAASRPKSGSNKSSSQPLSSLPTNMAQKGTSHDPVESSKSKSRDSGSSVNSSSLSYKIS